MCLKRIWRQKQNPLSKRNEAWDRLTGQYSHWWGHFPKCHYKTVFTYHLKFPMTLMVWSASETQVMGRWTTTWRSVNTWSPGSEAFTKYSNTPVWSAKFGASLKGGLPVQKIKYTSTLKHSLFLWWTCFQKFPLKIFSRFLTCYINTVPKIEVFKQTLVLQTHEHQVRH